MAKPAKKKSEPKQRKPRLTPEQVKALDAPKEATQTQDRKSDNLINEEDKALFLQTLPKIADLKAKLNTANSNLRNAYKTAKKDGFLKNDFDVAFQIQEAAGEKARKAAIARDLTIAKWLGCDLGAQLDLFVEDERVPAVDRAYATGESDSMQGKAAKPPYSQDTEQYRMYMKGFHDDTERRLKAGIKKTDDEPKSEAGMIPKPDQKPASKAIQAAADRAEKAAAKKKGDAPKDEPAAEDNKLPTSGTPMSRAQFAEMQANAAADGKPLFNRKAN